MDETIQLQELKTGHLERYWAIYADDLITREKVCIWNSNKTAVLVAPGVEIPSVTVLAIQVVSLDKVSIDAIYERISELDPSGSFGLLNTKGKEEASSTVAKYEKLAKLMFAGMGANWRDFLKMNFEPQKINQTIDECIEDLAYTGTMTINEVGWTQTDREKSMIPHFSALLRLKKH